MTKVTFRKFPDGEIIALFPELSWDNRGNVTSYLHNGQHGPADYTGVILRTTLATEEEYKDLLRELVEIVEYDDLKIIKKYTQCKS